MNSHKPTMEQSSTYNIIENRKVNKYSVALMLIGCITFYCLLGCDSNNTRQVVTLENDQTALGFDENTGAFLVFRNFNNSHDFLDSRIVHKSLWEIDILCPSGIKNY